MTDLIADIGGTNVRFALVQQDGALSDEKVMKCGDFPGLADAAHSYLSSVENHAPPRKAAFAIAGPVEGDLFHMTNHIWSFSVQDVRDALGLTDLKLFNDFHAIAMAIPHLDDAHCMQIGTQSHVHSEKPKVIIGPGTGLGVASLVWNGTHYIPVSGEGGHITMPAKTDREFDIFAWLIKEKYNHVSAERVCSGKGLVNLYDAIRALDGMTHLPDLTPEEISKAARDNNNQAAREAWDLMLGFLGTVAGNLALTLGAHGGVYIAGGILPQTADMLCHTRFRDQFEAKGRFQEYMAAIPTFLVNHPFPAFLGLQAYLSGKQSA